MMGLWQSIASSLTSNMLTGVNEIGNEMISPVSQDLLSPMTRARTWLSDFPPSRRQVLLGSVAITVLYLICVNNYWWCTPDSALYRELGRSIAEGEGYRFNGAVSNWVTPGLPLVLAGLRMLFGEAPWAGNLFASLCGLIGLVLIYRIIALLSDKRTAFAVVLATGFSYLYFTYSHMILTDIPFVTIYFGVFYCALRFQRGSPWWLIPAAALTVLGLSIRIPGVLVLGVLGVGLILEKSQTIRLSRRLVSAGVLLGTALATCGAYYLVARSVTSNTPPSLSGALAGVSDLETGLVTRCLIAIKDILRAFSKMLTANKGGWPIAIVPALLAAVGTVNFWKRGKRVVPILFWVYPLILIPIHRTGKVSDRYLLAIQPLLLLLVLEGLFLCVRRFQAIRQNPMNSRSYLIAASILVALVIGANARKVIRNTIYYAYYGRSDQYYNVINEGKFADLFAVAEVLQKASSPESIVGVRSDRARILHYLSRRLTVRFPRSERQSAEHARDIYRFFIDRPELRIAVVDLRRGKDAFRRELTEAFSQSPGLELLYKGKAYRVYRKVEGDSRSVSVRSRKPPRIGPSPHQLDWDGPALGPHL